jgi:hypothetical protein
MTLRLFPPAKSTQGAFIPCRNEDYTLRVINSNPGSSICSHTKIWIFHPDSGSIPKILNYFGIITVKIVKVNALEIAIEILHNRVD